MVDAETATSCPLASICTRTHGSGVSLVWTGMAGVPRFSSCAGACPNTKMLPGLAVGKPGSGGGGNGPPAMTAVTFALVGVIVPVTVIWNTGEAATLAVNVPVSGAPLPAMLPRVRVPCVPFQVPVYGAVPPG